MSSFSKLTPQEMNKVSAQSHLNHLLTCLQNHTHLVRRRQPKVSFSQLTSAKILAQRSAVPAVATHYTSSATLKRKKLSHEEKDRLLRIGKRPRRGPLSSVVDPTEVGEGSALMEVTEAVKNSGTYDVWQGDDSEVEDVIVPIKKPAVKVSNTSRVYRLQMLMKVHRKATASSPPKRAHRTLCSPITSRRNIL